MFKDLYYWFRTSTALQRSRISTTLIMVLAAAVSYTDQHDLLLQHGVKPFAAYVDPLTVDILAITCNIIVHVPGLRLRGLITSILVLIAAVGVSGTANYMAGHTQIEKYANLWAVVAYLLSEFVTASAKPKVKSGDKSGELTVKETVNAIADKMPVPVSPAGPVVFQPPTEPKKKDRQNGRSGPQVSRPVMSPLDPTRVLLEEPPQV